MNRAHRFVWLLVMVLATAFMRAPRNAFGLSLFWDGTGTSWGTASFWSTSSSATTPDPGAPPGAFDVANFNISGVSNQTVNLNANRSALGLVFTGTSGTMLIQTGSGTNTLTLGNSGITVNSGAGADTISSLISLNGTQTWTDNSSNLLTISNNVSNGANTLNIAGTGDVTISGNIGGGSGAVSKSGSGTLTLSGTNSFTGNLLVNTGVVIISSANNVGSAALVAVQTGGTLQTTADLTLPTLLTVGAGGSTINTSAGTLTVANISGTGTLTKNGAGTLTITGTANTYSGGTTINAGTLAAGANGSLGNVAGAISFGGGTLKTTAGFSSARTITLNAAGGTVDTSGGDLTLSGTIGGTGALTKTGAGILTLSGSNSFTGNSLINGGTVAVGADFSLGNAAGEILLDGGTLRSTAPFSSARAITINAAGGTFELTGGGDLTLTGPIGGAGTLRISGAGTVTLSNATNNYNGGTSVLNAATVAVSSDSNFGAAAGTLTLDSGFVKALAGFTMNRQMSLSSGGGFFDTNNFDVTLSGKLTGTGSLVKVGLGTLTLTNISNNYSGGTTIGGGTVAIADNRDLGATSGAVSLSGGTLRTTASFSSSRNFILNSGAIDTAGNDLTLSGVISGTGGLTKLGAGTLTPTTITNSYSGPTSIQGGAIAINSALQLGSTSSITLDNGTLSTSSISFGSITLSAPIFLGAGNGIFDVRDTLSLQGIIGGAGSLTKSGAGALQLGTSATVNTYSGGTEVSGTNTSTLIINADSNLGAPGTSVLMSNGTLEIDSSMSSNRPLIHHNGTLSVGNGASVTWNGPISGFNGFVKTGAGTLTLSNSTNSYTSGTSVSDGTLVVNSDGSLGAAAGSISIRNNAMLEIPSGFTTSRAIFLTNGGTVFSMSGTFVANGQITGSGPLTIAGNGGGVGRVTLGSLNNSYTGGTSVQSGFVSISTDANLGDVNGALTLNYGTLQALASFNSARPINIGIGSGIFDTNGNNVTLTGPMTGDPNGFLIKNGAGVLTVSNSGFAGGAQVNAGQLILMSGSYGNSMVARSGTTLTLTSGQVTPGLGSLSAAGGTIEYNSETINGGDLNGNGVHHVLSGSTVFNALSIFNGVDLRLDAQTSFNRVVNGGKITDSAPFNWSNGQNSSSGNLIINAALTTEFWSSDGLITINPGGSITNTNSNPVLGGGSRTYVGSVGSPGGTLQTNGATTIELNGGLLVNNGTLVGTLNVNYGSLAKGAGTYGVVNVTDGGVYAPGNSPGIVTASAVAFSNTSTIGGPTLSIEIAGIAPGTLYDQLHVTDALSLGGTLAVSLLNGFSPALGNSFDILDWGSLSGTFRTLQLPALNPNLVWNTTQLYTAGVLSVGLAGDFNFDNHIDAADYVIWRKTDGTQAGYDAWRTNFGRTSPGSGAGASANGNVPEPAIGSLLLIMGVIAICSYQCRAIS